MRISRSSGVCREARAPTGAAPDVPDGRGAARR
jgi:hypothetical protein